LESEPIDSGRTWSEYIPNANDKYQHRRPRRVLTAPNCLPLPVGLLAQDEA